MGPLSRGYGIISSYNIIEQLVSNVCNDGIDSGATESNKEESGNQEAQLQYEVWIPGTTSPSSERLTIPDRLKELYEHTASDQEHLKCKFVEIKSDDATDKPELDPYEAASIKDLSATRIDLVPDIISECRGRVQSDGNENEKYGVISLQEWKKALKKKI